MKVWLLWVGCAFLLSVGCLRAGDEERTIVVYNKKDAGSQELAFFYAEKRKIPERQLVALDCPIEEEISREQYIDTIEKPLRAAFDRNGWWKTVPDFEAPHPRVAENKIRYVALIRGIPLKIRASKTLPTVPALKMPGPTGGSNEACVDSELAAMGINPFTPWGLMPNPYYRSYAKIEEANFPDLLLVARLDGPFISTVKKMIEDSIAAEQNGLEGRAYIDLHAVGFGLAEGTVETGNSWMRGAADQCRRNGIPVVVEHTGALFRRGYPIRDAILYYGWYREHAYGPFADPSFRFVPGAVSIHLHSFSGQSIRDPLRGWTAPLVERGVAATIGNVYEPYLAFTPQIDVFNERLLAGFTFAESAYMSLRAVSWMTSVIGDPLYRPFAAWHRIPRDEVNTAWQVFRKAVVESKLSGSAEPIDALKKQAEKKRDSQTLEFIALWESGEGNLPGAIRVLEFARSKAEGVEADALALEQICLLRLSGKKEAALKIVRSRVDKTTGDLQGVFKDLEMELNPPATPRPSL